MNHPPPHPSSTSCFPSSVAPPAPFLRSLRQILDAESCSVISWTPDGAAFEIYDVLSMAKHVLPKYFKHANYSSFQRQLNYFRFRKWTRLQTQICTFSNPFFRRDAPELMRHIIRKKSPSRQAASYRPDPRLEPIAYSSMKTSAAMVPASPSDVTGYLGYYPQTVAELSFFNQHSVVSGAFPASVGEWLPHAEPLAAVGPLAMAGEPTGDALEWLDALYPSLDAVKKLDDTRQGWHYV